MKKHLMISTGICILTLFIIIPFYGRLPEQVPIHWDSAGNVNRMISKGLFALIFPVFGVALNLIAFHSLTKKGEKRTAMYYIIPAILVVAVIVALVLAL